MAIKDPEVGVRAIVKDADKFLADLRRIQAEASKTAAHMQTMARTATPAAATFQDLGVAANSAAASIVGLGVKIAAAVVAIKALVELGARGSIVSGVEESYSRLMHVIGMSADEMLARSNQAAAGLISNFNLMRQTNILIAGSTADTARILAEAVPDLINISRTLARATGGDIEYYFNSLTQGIKRFEPRLIDNTGLIIKVGEATRSFAEAMDMTTQSMTAEQKMIAILNATLLAGNIAMATYGDTTDEVRDQMSALFTQMSEGRITAEEFNNGMRQLRETAGSMFQAFTAFEQLQRIRTTFEEIRNTLGQTFEPAIRIVLGLINELVTVFKDALNELGPMVAGTFEVIGPLIAGAVTAFINVLRPIVMLVKNIFGGVLKVVAWFGFAFATLMLKVANTFIFPVVLKILETLASWMVGSSPPPAGPLKDIDIGAQRIMEAWIMGLAGVSLDPVHKVLQEVNTVLGDVQFWSHEPVKARLLELDLALRPFEERVKLLSAHFEAMKEPVEAAFRSIDRQLEKAVKAMLTGDQEAAALVRQLDAQRQALRGYVNTQEDMIDNAKVQLQITKSQQALERAILEIQLSRLGPEEKEQKIRELKEKAARGGIDAVERELRGLGNIPGSDAPPFGFETGVEAFINEVRSFAGIGAAYDEEMRTLRLNEARVAMSFGRIARTSTGRTILNILGIDPENAASQASAQMTQILETIQTDQDLLNMLGRMGSTFMLEVISGADDQSRASNMTTRTIGATLLDNMLGGALTREGADKLTLEFVTGLVNSFSDNAPKVREAIGRILAGEGTIEDYQILGTTAAGLFRSGITGELEATDPRSEEGQRLATAIGNLFSNSASAADVALITNTLGREFIDNFIGGLSVDENEQVRLRNAGNRIINQVFETSSIGAITQGEITATAYALAIVTHLETAQGDSRLQQAINNIIAGNASEDDYTILGNAAAQAYLNAIRNTVTGETDGSSARSELNRALSNLAGDFNNRVNVPIRRAVYGPNNPGQPPAIASILGKLPDLVLASFANMNVRFTTEVVEPVRTAAATFSTAADNIQRRLDEFLEYMNSSTIRQRFSDARQGWIEYSRSIASAEEALRRFRTTATRLMSEEGFREAMWNFGVLNERQNPPMVGGAAADVGAFFPGPPGRASGGAVTGSIPYLVGEKGPEILKLPPGVNGWIYNNSISRDMVQRRSFHLPPEDTNQKILNSVFGSRPSVPVVSSSTSSVTDDHSTTYGDIIFNGLRDSPAALRRFMMMKVARR